ncbi:hypothetical protein FQN54_007512 [Arachnomyces sp. PD_36]|nr:hypothetical protein FQN54_007512 [Arachnomyces sp. PD_36]
MPPRKQWIDKKSATTFHLLHRSQNDPLIHEDSAEDRVLHKVAGPPVSDAQSTASSSKATRKLADLNQEFQSKVRQNEGEAANYGVFYDDSSYDYMQHLKELGGGGGQAQFIEAAAKGKGKGKAEKLEDALGKVSLDDGASSKSHEISEFGSVYGDDYYSTASSYSRQPSYQDQQNIPDAIAGFKPDMDPRLREALEALEDDAFVGDDDEEDLFESLVEGGRGGEMDPGEWEDMYEEDDGWESDATEKAPNQSDTTAFKSIDTDGGVSLTTAESSQQDSDIPDTAPADGDWLREFAKYKKDMKKPAAPPTQSGNISEFRTAPSTMFTAGGTPVRTKKRKGAKTNPSAYSMTSSSLARTDGLRLLDDRFEKVEALYSLDEEVGDFDDASGVESMSMTSGMSGLSQAPSLVSRGEDPPLRSDFDQVMDGFLEGWTDRGANAKRKGAKGKRGKNGNEVAGIKMLDEVRQGLGPARFTGKA